MLASGAHVRIGGIDYLLDEEQEPHYTHRFESLFAPTSAIAGEIAKEQIRPEKLLWAITDWSGGEGGRIYYPQDPTTYDFGSLMNPTVRGQLTTRTKRRRSAVARAGANADTGKRPAGASAWTQAVIGWEDNILTSTDAITWAAAQDITPDMSVSQYSDAIADGNNVAFMALDNLGATADSIPVVAGGGTTWADTHTGTAVDPPIVGAVLDGVPYTLSEGAGSNIILKKKATAMSIAGDWGATTIFDTGIILPSSTGWGSDFWTSCVAAETSLFFSYATKTQSYVWEARNDVGRPYWTPGPGIVIKKLIYTEGILFAIGNQTAAGKNFAFIRAVPLATRSPILVALPRKHQNTELTDFSVGCAGPDSTIFAADAVSGKIFVYDIPNDALHLFDDLTNGGTGDGMSYGANERISFLAMHGSRLFGATHTSGGSATSLQVFSYDDLEPANRDASQAISATLETAEWDFGLPMEIKGLIGFYVTYKVTDAATASGLLANTRVKVEYSRDDAAYETAATMTSATVIVGEKGRHFIQVSDGTTTKKFTRLKVKLTLDNNATAVAPPILFGVTAEAQLLAYAETWDLAVRVADEEQNERPTSRQNEAASQRDNLEDLATNKNVVTFLDGYRYKQPNRFTTHTIVVEDPVDDIRTVSEGVMRVKLRAIV